MSEVRISQVRLETNPDDSSPTWSELRQIGIIEPGEEIVFHDFTGYRESEEVRGRKGLKSDFNIFKICNPEDGLPFIAELPGSEGSSSSEMQEKTQNVLVDLSSKYPTVEFDIYNAASYQATIIVEVLTKHSR